jgi:hypothetical protein
MNNFTKSGIYRVTGMSGTSKIDIMLRYSQSNGMITIRKIWHQDWPEFKVNERLSSNMFNLYPDDKVVYLGPRFNVMIKLLYV